MILSCGGPSSAHCSVPSSRGARPADQAVEAEEAPAPEEVWVEEGQPEDEEREDEGSSVNDGTFTRSSTASWASASSTCKQPQTSRVRISPLWPCSPRVW